MRNGRSAATLCVIAALAAPLGCGRSEPPPVPDVVTQTPANSGPAPATLAGCLRAGEASDTFVLTTTAPKTATYHLVPGPGIDLRSHVGRQVHLEGIVAQQQETVTRTEPEKDERASGTTGRPDPDVATSTEFEAGRLEVRRIRTVGGECE